MKVWQLSSVVDCDLGLLTRTAVQRPEWAEYADWYSNYKQIVSAQDRGKLDHVLPTGYVLAVLSQINREYFRGRDGWLRSRRRSPDDEVFSAADAFKKYGGEKLEAALEHGADYVG